MAEQRPQINMNLLNRVFLEAVEIAFQECAEDGTNFGESKVSHVINSIIPSGYVLGSSYWFLYTDRKRGGKLFCICERFGHSCGHKVDDKLSADYTDYGDMYFFTSLRGGFIAPVNVTLNISQQEDNVVVVVVSIDKLELELYDENTCSLNPIDKVKPVDKMFFNFRIVEPKGPLLETFSLIPHPFTCFRYGRMIPQLRKYKLTKIPYCKSKLDISEDVVQKCTIMPIVIRDHIPEEIFIMAPISQEIFKGQTNIQASHTFIPHDHAESSFDFVNCRQGELMGTRHWNFMKSVTKAVLPKVEGPDQVPKDTFVMTDDLSAMMAYELEKKIDISGNTLISVVDQFPNITIADANDAVITQRIRPILVMNEPVEYQPPNEEVHNGTPVLLKLFKAYSRNFSNNKNVFTVSENPPPN